MRRVIRPQSRRHLWLYDEDWDYVSSHVAARTRLPPGSWVREMLHRVVLQLREERYLTQEAGEKLLDHLEAQGDKPLEPLKTERNYNG
jgi:hypothetical protein